MAVPTVSPASREEVEDVTESERRIAFSATKRSAEARRCTTRENPRTRGTLVAAPTSVGTGTRRRRVFSGSTPAMTTVAAMT